MDDVELEVTPEEETAVAVKPLWFKALAELVGTCLLVFFGVLSALQFSGDPTVNDLWGKLIAVSLAFGLIVMVLVYTIGGVSGAHLNPAASMAMAIDGRLKWKEYGFYVLAQVIGAFLGALLVWAFLGQNAGNIVSTTFNQDMIQASSWAADGVLAIILEVFGTAVFLYAVLAVTADPKNGAIAGVVIALALWLSIAVLFNLTGGSLNPARSLGTALVALFNDETEPIKEIWVYIIGPMAGSVLAAYTYRFFNKSRYALAA